MTVACPRRRWVAAPVCAGPPSRTLWLSFAAGGWCEPPPTAVGGRGNLEVVIARSGAVIGVDYRERSLRAGVADLGGRVLAEAQRPLPDGFGVGESSAEAGALIRALLDRAGITPNDVLQVGVGLPVPIDRISGRLGSQPHLHRWVDADPRATLEEALGLPVMIDNDCNLGALGELRQGAGRGFSDVIYISAGDAVGAGCVLNGRLHRGVAGTAGEIGHMTVDPHGESCPCGNRGCLDTVIGSTSFLNPLRRVYGAGLDIAQVIELAAQGDMRCHRALTDAGRALGVVVADLCNLLSPQRVIVAGPIFGAGDVILAPLRETLVHRAVPAAVRVVEIVRSRLSDRATMVGAVWMALDAIQSRAARSALCGGFRELPNSAPAEPYAQMTDLHGQAHICTT